MAQIPSGGGSGVSGGSGSIRIADITPQDGDDVVDTKVWQDPAHTVLQSCRSTSLDINVSIVASFPKVEIDGNAANLVLSGDGGHYSGTVPITMAAAGDIVAKVFTPNDEEGASDTAALTLSLPAQITALSFTGGYPGVQTEMAEGQTYDLVVTADKSFNQVLVADQDAGYGNGAGGEQVISVAPGLGPTIVSMTVADRGVAPQLLPAHVRVRDTATGAYSDSRSTNELGGGVDGVDVINLNDRYPVIDGIGKGGATGHNFGVAYPGAQGALKGAETADVTDPCSYFDTIVYGSPGSQLDVAPTGTYANPKTVTRISGDYNVSTDNFRITANRAANGTQTIVQGVIKIANVAAQASVSFSGSRLRSGVSPGASTVITLGFNQQMAGTPVMDPTSGRGTFLGSWTGGPTSWVRTLQVPDSENPADNSSYPWTNVLATNLAGIQTTSITTGPTYVIGGFTARTVSFPAFTADCNETFPLTTEAKLSVGVFSNGNTGVLQPYGTSDITDPDPQYAGYCAPTATDGTAVKIHMLHVPTVQANSGTITLTLVQEAT